MSLILRHKPEIIDISLDEHGWAAVNELINGIARNNEGFDMATLEEIVKTDNKQRYSFNADKTLIRANQGHSIPVDVEFGRERAARVSLSWNWRKICFIHSRTGTYTQIEIIRPSFQGCRNCQKCRQTAWKRSCLYNCSS